MVVAFIVLGMIFGASAAAYTLISGGGLLLALAAYSVVGTLATLVAAVAMVTIGHHEIEEDEWAEKRKDDRALSA